MTVKLELSESTMERALRLAAARNETLEQLITDLVEEKPLPQASSDRVIGMFAEDADLLDEIVEEAMRDREARRPRLFHG